MGRATQSPGPCVLPHSPGAGLSLGLTFSLKGCVSVCTALGPVGRAIKMELGVRHPGVARALGSSQPLHEEAVLE